MSLLVLPLPHSRGVMYYCKKLELVRTYQVTRKRQVTIPTELARKMGVRPGDSVVFEESEGRIVLRKVTLEADKPEELKAIVEDFARDVAEVKQYIEEAGEGLIENLSRYIAPERHSSRRVK